jgi:hypothetical protein
LSGGLSARFGHLSLLRKCLLRLVSLTPFFCKRRFNSIEPTLHVLQLSLRFGSFTPFLHKCGLRRSR